MRKIVDVPSKEQFEVIYKLSKKLNSIDYEESLIEEALDLVINAVKAERGLFVKYGKNNKSFSIIAARNVRKENIISIEEFSSGILNQVIQKNEPILYHDAQQEPAISTFESVMIKEIKSIIGVPVYYGDDLWGIIIADSQTNREKFTEQNLSLLELFSNLLSLTLDRIIKSKELFEENRLLHNQLESFLDIPEIIGKSKVMKELITTIYRVAQTDATVLITGESGTGKDLVARAIHSLSARKDRPFLAQFCGSIPDNLLESELFGYKKGAFTGATSDKKGLFEATNNGTFFLDEIADISPALQAKLLRVLENKEIIRIGDTQTRKIDIRIITATNKKLQELVRNNEFREDLFYRLNVFPIIVPPLRKRKTDISILSNYFITQLGYKNYKIQKMAMAKLENYNWPGNVRQLKNVIHRALILAQNNTIVEDNIIITDDDEINIYEGTLNNIELQIVKRRLKEFGGNKTLAAKSLGVSRKWIYLKLDEKTKNNVG